MAEHDAITADEKPPSARVVAVQDDLVTIELPGDTGSRGYFIKNEVIRILPRRCLAEGRLEKLKGEVLRIRGRRADAQVFENTSGVSIGDPVELSRSMLSVRLGPGLLGRVYDGLQNPLEELAKEHGLFLPRGVESSALDTQQEWLFHAAVKRGDTVRAGDTLGTVQEGSIKHKILAPFDLAAAAEVGWIQEGSVTVLDPVVELEHGDGQRQHVTLQREWPIRRAVSQNLLQAGLSERLFPDEPLITSIRLIDTFFPIAKGGMACIPGPFGAGKTVLQNLISRYSDVDVVVIVACGERAGEVVETITEFPRLPDPRTGGSLMERTIIICNTSSMPVAAREASIFTGITIAEYYRQLGLHVLLLADSTSRWAQAMRETSGRLEEIPGEEAFPAYLDSSIKAVYERAGAILTNDRSKGSLTMIGTVSPAGGNFEEPVTQSTLTTVKTFLGLSADRAYKRYYPAVDPLISWSRYSSQLSPWFDGNLYATWTQQVGEMIQLLRDGDAVLQMMQVTGEEGVTLSDFVTYHRALLLDLVYIQQDAFDPVDVFAPLPRQREIFPLVYRLLTRDLKFADKDEVRNAFTQLTGLFKNLNSAAYQSAEYQRLNARIEAFGTEGTAAAGAAATDS